MSPATPTRLSSNGGPIALGTLLLGLAVVLSFGAVALFYGSIEHTSSFPWIGIAAAGLAVGGMMSRHARGPQLFGWSVLWTFGLAALGVWLWGPAGGFASAPVRNLLVLPVVLLLVGYFGASLGMLRRAGVRVFAPGGYESWVGRRFLLAKRGSVLSTVTWISLAGVALGVWLVIVSLSVLSGFEKDLEQKIVGANAEIRIQRADERPFPLTPELQSAIASAPRVRAYAPVLQSEVALASSANYTAGVVMGIDAATTPAVLTVLQKLREGSLSAMTPQAPLPDGGIEPAGVVLGVEMARSLNVRVGDTLRIISPTIESLTPLGVAPKSMGLRVAAIFASDMYEYDARYAFVALPTARKFMELEPDDVTGLLVRTDDPDTADAVGTQLRALLPSPLTASDWQERNATLFSALKLERVVAFIVLVFIILVASFAIVNTLTMSVIEKSKEIAILKTMGAPDAGIMKLFLVQGLWVGMLGTLGGTACALATVYFLKSVGFAIPGDVYYIQKLPVHLEGIDVVLVNLAAFFIVWDFAVLPALKGARLRPVEGLVHG